MYGISIPYPSRVSTKTFMNREEYETLSLIKGEIRACSVHYWDIILLSWNDDSIACMEKWTYIFDIFFLYCAIISVSLVCLCMNRKLMMMIEVLCVCVYVMSILCCVAYYYNDFGIKMRWWGLCTYIQVHYWYKDYIIMRNVYL